MVMEGLIDPHLASPQAIFHIGISTLNSSHACGQGSNHADMGPKVLMWKKNDDPIDALTDPKPMSFEIVDVQLGYGMMCSNHK